MRTPPASDAGTPYRGADAVDRRGASEETLERRFRPALDADPRWKTTRVVDADPRAPLTPRSATDAERAFLRRLAFAPVAVRLVLAVGIVDLMLGTVALLPLTSRPSGLEVSFAAFVAFLVPILLGGRVLYQRSVVTALGRPPLRLRRGEPDAALQQVTGAYDELQTVHDYRTRLRHPDVRSQDPARVHAETVVAMPPHWRRYLLPGAYAAALGRTLGRGALRQGVTGIIHGTGQQFYAVSVTQAFTLVRLSRETGTGVPGGVLHGDPDRMVLSVEREASWGGADLVWYRPVRLVATAVAGVTACLGIALVGAGVGATAFGADPTLSGLALTAVVFSSRLGGLFLTGGALAAPLAAFSVWRHMRASRRIAAAYAQEGLVPWPQALRAEWARSPPPNSGLRGTALGAPEA